MIYLYGLALLLTGCITNNAYTQTGDGEHKVVSASGETHVDRLNKDSDVLSTTTENIETTGIHKGTKLGVAVTNTENTKK